MSFASAFLLRYTNAIQISCAGILALENTESTSPAVVGYSSESNYGSNDDINVGDTLETFKTQ